MKKRSLTVVCVVMHRCLMLFEDWSQHSGGMLRRFLRWVAGLPAALDRPDLPGYRWIASGLHSYAPQIPNLRYGRCQICSTVAAIGLITVCLQCPVSAASDPDFYSRADTWQATVLACQTALASTNLVSKDRDEAATRIWERLGDDFPIQSDWMLQDGGTNGARLILSPDETGQAQWMIERVIQELGAQGSVVQDELAKLCQTNSAAWDKSWLDLYVKACELRRQRRLTTVLDATPRIVFTKRRTIRPSFFAYTEGQSDAQAERHFLPGSELCLLQMDGLYGKVRRLLSAPGGVIRDPAVSWNGRRILFAWKKSLNEDDYHLHELDLASRDVRQITEGAGVADYEPAYLPNGDIIFSSTRCVQTVDCWWTEVSNLYSCAPDGTAIRRLGFDQVHTVYPQVTDDGRVIYTRWDYNDRGQVFTQALFQMSPDGTGQAEFYGNNSWFPTTIAHARGIPGTQKVLAILCGHHSSQAGKLAVIDPARGRQENSGVQLVAPVRATPAVRIDSYGQDGPLWQYPYPLNERECLVTFAPLGWDVPARRKGDAAFGIYWMDLDGRRELLASDPQIPCSQPVPFAERPRPMVHANRVDYRQTNAMYFVQDVYAGPGLAGVPRGTIRRMRVIALDFRAAGIGNNGSSGPGGSALVSTPVSIGNGSWDVKRVLGDAIVHEDGSALFTVPPRIPVYFQALDEKGRAIQTMRSWSTLQPGEYASCVGCHEHKNSTVPTASRGFSHAMQAGPQPLELFFGPPRGFSFIKEIQPILDRNCIRCHKNRAPILERIRGKTQKPEHASFEPFSLLGDVTVDPVAKRKWSDAYLALTQSKPMSAGEQPGDFRGDCNDPMVNWISSQSVPEPLPPGTVGSVRSGLMTLLEKGHKGVQLSREDMAKIACWIDLLVPYCGDYTEANAWSPQEIEKYQRFADKRRKMEAIDRESINDLLSGRTPSRPSEAFGSMRGWR